MANFKGIPTPIIRRKGIDPKAKSGALRGDVCLQLKDALTGKITDEFRGHNMLTNGLESAMNGCPFDLNKIDGGNSMTSGTWRYNPIYEQLLGGLILFPQALGNDANLLSPSFANSPTGFASMDSYQQGDSRQGSYDAVSSGLITNGFRHVFSWGSAFGNGTIASLGLAPKYCEGWCIDIDKRIKPIPTLDGGFGAHYSPAYSLFCVGASEDGMLLVTYDSTVSAFNKISFYSQQRPHAIRLTEKFTSGAWIDLNENDPYPFSNEHRNGYTWSVSIPELTNYSNQYRLMSLQIIGNYVYIVSHTANGDTFTVTRLSLTDGSVVDTNTYTFSASFGNCRPVFWNGYIYCGSSTAGTVYKCNCSNIADVVGITSSVIPANAQLRFTGGQWIYNENFILDASSDILVGSTRAGYLDADAYPIYDNGMWILSFVRNNFGCYLYANMKQWGLMTHFDLQNAVVKTPDKQMEVQYSITQV